MSARTREMGVRMALGAQGASVVRLILRQGMTQVAVGLLLGLGLALLLARAMRMVLYDVSPTDPVVFTAVAAVLSPQRGRGVSRAVGTIISSGLMPPWRNELR